MRLSEIQLTISKARSRYYYFRIPTNKGSAKVCFMTSKEIENKYQPQEEFVSLFDLLQYVQHIHSENITNATYDILTILQEEDKKLDVYKFHSGIKPRITLQEKPLNDYLLKINRNQGYKTQGLDSFNDDIPF